MLKFLKKLLFPHKFKGEFTEIKGINFLKGEKKWKKNFIGKTNTYMKNM